MIQLLFAFRKNILILPKDVIQGIIKFIFLDTLSLIINYFSMKKFVMIALLPSNEVKAFKAEVETVYPEAKYYNALTDGIRCRQEAVAVELPEDSLKKLYVYFQVSQRYSVEFPQVLPERKRLLDRVCTFCIDAGSDAACDDLLSMWERCSKAVARLSPEERQVLHFAIYADKMANTVNFQACYSFENDFQAWQQAVTDFCLAFMADYGGRLQVSFDQCLFYKNDR